MDKVFIIERKAKNTMVGSFKVRGMVRALIMTTLGRILRGAE